KSQGNPISLGISSGRNTGQYCHTLRRGRIALCHTNTKQDNWDVYVPLLLYAYRTSPQKSTGTSPYQVLFGRLAPPLEGSRELSDDARSSDEWIAELKEAQRIIHEQVARTQDRAKDEMVRQHKLRQEGSYASGDRVLVRQASKGRARKLAKKWTGPFDVVQQVSPQVVLLRHPKGHDFKLNMERVKPFREKRDVEKTGSKQSSPSSENEDEEYEVEAIVDHRDRADGREYKVRWVGYTARDDSWVRAADIQADRLVQDYLDSSKLSGGTATVPA
ncbi:MAG: chromo domain-containing protein, partial [Fimbriimonadaceae bacterium]